MSTPGRKASNPGAAPGGPVGTAAKLTAMAFTTTKTVATVAGCGYVGVCALLYFVQRKLQYFPTREDPPAVRTLPEPCRDIEEIAIRTSDGETLKAWHWPAPSNGKHKKVNVLQLHGNAGSRHNRLYWAHHLRNKLGCGVTLLDYRGYGGSTGVVTEPGMIKDGVAGVQWASTRAAEDGCKLVLHLESIGSGAGVCALGAMADAGDAAGKTVAGVVAEGGLSSCVEIAEKIFTWLPLRLLMKDKWLGVCRAAGKLSPSMPFLSIHGEKDEIVPLWCGKKLFAAVAGEEGKNKIFHEVPRGGHNNLMEMPGYFPKLGAFYTKVEEA